MSYHVDIMKRDPLSAWETVLARVVLENEKITIEAEYPGFWLPTLAHITGVDPEQNPRIFLESLYPKLGESSMYSYYYFVARPAHESDDCPPIGKPVSRLARILKEQSENG